ncbi:uncharacterized protein LOC127005170 [Eriocheir sinensis]|uniref:uncharacterized protein LOC127005170 n=1 Tax=Eriocheir sinensis TaxID=95602 RepID=UPI0021C94C39|nr:uncharacterized protein LOC127005170 [Eriocheir sinensis]
MNSKVLFVLALVAVAAADKRPRPSYGAPPPPPPQPSYSAPQPVYSAPESSEEFEPPKYNFEWEVKDQYSGNDFEHQEERDDDNTQGAYSVQLPDGRLQRVTYYVNGDSGYIAEVTYEGEAEYPSAESRESYGPPQPSYSAPESEESVEAPVYSPPRPQYAPPQPSYSPPQRTYGRPQ